MKKITIVYLLAACSCYFVLTGYHLGAGSSNGYQCTGAETGLGNPAGCAAGCHSSSATTSIGITIELDSVGVPTTHYKAGMTYTVKLSGINNGAATPLLPRFGMQMGSIKGSVALTTPVNAGTWSASCPAGTHYAAPQASLFVVGVVEQSSAILATTGTGGTGTTYVKTFTWTAPIAGTGTISFWGVINAVNGNGNSDSGDKWNTTHKTITEWPGTTGISEADSNKPDFSVFPNPAADWATIHYSTLPEFAKGEIRITDISGKTAEIIPVANGSTSTEVDCANFANGIYFLSLIVNDEIRNTEKIVIAK